MKRTIAAAAIVMGSAAFFTGSAFASGFTPDNPASNTIAVGLTIEDECTISTPGLDFGTHGVLESNIETQGDISIECTKGTAYAIALDAGVNASGVVANRAMNSGTDKIGYQLYSDSGFSSVWGDTFGTTTVGSASATGDAETHTVYARVPIQTSQPIGTYADTVTATIWYADNVTGP
jgi:spore coat protein U domain-containing protein, fimbrial subunit CupE1/2/3/6